MSGESDTRRRIFQQSIGLLRPFCGLLFIYAAFLIYDLFWDAESFQLRWWDGGLETFPRLFGTEPWGYNLKVVATQTSIVAIAALGMTLIIVSGGIDLSPGSVIALVTVVIALCLRGLGAPETTAAAIVYPLVAVLAGVITATLVGLVNGLLITRLSIVPFIVTLGMMSVTRGLAKLFSGESRVNPPDTWLNDLLVISKQDSFFRLPSGIVLLLLLAALIAAALRYTVFGRYVFAIGSSEATARLCGVRVAGQKVFIYALSGSLVGIAALLEFTELKVGDPTTAVAKELDIIAAVVIGGGSLRGGRGSILGTLIGAFIIGILRNGCVLYDISDTIQEIVIGMIIVAATAVDQLQARRLKT
ncbi:MAG: ABC transporter permease [Planctomycetota bacterium]|nr:ABC transporter permease [Planctomycetota bacterium]